ncbi:MAG: 50S ribosomal protein L25 [Nitrospirota bacterium]
MKQIPLEANTRSDVGKGYCRRLRVKGLMPGVLYGGGKESIPVELKSADLIHILREGGENVLINFTLPDLPQETVILKEKQRHPYKNFLLHADFCRISLKEKLTVTAPIELIGTAKGVKEGGILEQVMWDVEISALPQYIPESIKVDVTKLEIGATVHIKDLIAEEEVEIKNDPELVVLHIALLKEAKVGEGVSAEGVAEPEVIREKKKVEEEKK